MTTEQIFQKAVQGVIDQGRASVTASGDCKYRSRDGTKCAVGQLIRHKFYNSSIENNSINYFLVSGAVEHSIERKLSPEEFSILEDLQQAHDSFAEKLDSIKHWYKETRRIAKKYSLDYDSLIKERN